jgi:hypothetical protein
MTDLSLACPSREFNSFIDQAVRSFVENAAGQFVDVCFELGVLTFGEEWLDFGLRR